MLTEKVKSLSVYKRFLYWIKERQAIYLKWLEDKPKPWTTDEILRDYKFCNVHREQDRVTQWLRMAWRQPHAKDPDLWFAMVIARMINWPATLEEIGYPSPEPKSLRRIIEVCHSRRGDGAKVFTGAYTISTNGLAGDKIELLVEHVFAPMLTKSNILRPTRGMLLGVYHERLHNNNGIGTFLSGQIIADLKETKGQPLHTAKDYWTWAASGPGSRRGLNRVLEQDKDQRWNEWEWLLRLRQLRDRVLKDMPGLEIHCQDLQNCLCEFDKYERVLWGEGRPRSKYPGAA